MRGQAGDEVTHPLSWAALVSLQKERDRNKEEEEEERVLNVVVGESFSVII